MTTVRVWSAKALPKIPENRGDHCEQWQTLAMWDHGQTEPGKSSRNFFYHPTKKAMGSVDLGGGALMKAKTSREAGERCG